MSRDGAERTISRGKHAPTVSIPSGRPRNAAKPVWKPVLALSGVRALPFVLTSKSILDMRLRQKGLFLPESQNF